MEQIIAALVPVTVFYAIYSRYFLFRPEIIKHVEALLAGVFFALLLLVVPSYIPLHLNIQHPVLVALLKAALPEKIGAFIIILILQRHYPNFSLMEGAISAMMFGIGFSIIENAVYAVNFGISVIIIRLIFSVPLHMTTCGIMGYYLGFRKMSSTGNVKFVGMLRALSYPLLIHWIFDSLLLIKYPASYFAAPLLIVTVLALEYLLARSQIVAPLDILRAMRLRFEDWLSIDRQPKYERWISQSMGIPGSQSLSIFAWRPGISRLAAVVFLISLALFGITFRVDITSFFGLNIAPEEEIILLGIYPSSIAIILILVGAINPNFMKTGKLKIPVIADADVYHDGAFAESMVTYDFSLSSCFLRTSEALGIGEELELEFQFKKWRSPRVIGKVVWENHTLYGEDNPTGSVLALKTDRYGSYLGFLTRYYLFRLSRGIAFNLRLPGFETTRKYFMRPHTTMQSIKLFNAGEEIFREGDEGNEFYLLKKGRVLFYKRIESGEMITMETITDGELFGEMAIMGKNSRAATAKCLTDCVVAVADIENLNALIFGNPDFSGSLIRKLVERLQTSEQVLIANIKSLEREKRDTEKLLHAAVTLALIGIGNPLENDSVRVKIDGKKIAKALKNVDDEVISEIINIILTRRSLDSDGESGERVNEAVNMLYEKYRIEQID